MELVDSHQQIRIELRSIECQCRSVLFLRLIAELDILSRLESIIASWLRFNGPINEGEFTFIGSTPEQRLSLS